MSHVEHSLQLIREQLDYAQRPIVTCSFGKDSIVLLHLCLQIKKVPVLYLKLPKFQRKNAQANRVIHEWDLEVFEQLPYSTTFVERNNVQEALEIYRTGRHGYLALMVGFTARKEGEPYLCIVDDVYGRPHTSGQEYPWDVTFSGHKTCDRLSFLDTPPQRVEPVFQIDGTRIVCPLAEWTDSDIWDYIHQHSLPYDALRYDQLQDAGNPNYAENPDYYPACLNCVEGKSRGQEVWCPKYGRAIESISASPEEREQFRQELIGTLRYIKREPQPEGV